MSVFKAYIAGPMSGIPKFNFPAFEAAAIYLRESLGWEVVSPHELDNDETRAWAEASTDGEPQGRWGEFLGRDLELIRNGGINQIVLLDGWHESQGARLESALGLDCGVGFWQWNGEQDWAPPVAGISSRSVAEALGRPLWKGDDPDPVVFGPGTPPLPNIIADAAVPRDRIIAAPSEEAAKALLAEFKTAPVLTVGAPEPVVAHFDEEPDPRVDTDHGEVRVTDPETGGAKGSKPQRTDLIPPEFLLGLAEVYGTGAAKYSEFNYALGYPWRLSLGAMQRHVLLWAGGQDYDEETGHHHLLHAAWHCACLFQFQMFARGTDDRMRWDDADWPGEAA